MLNLFQYKKERWGKEKDKKKGGRKCLNFQKPSMDLCTDFRTV